MAGDRRVSVVTGGAGGLGFAIAERLARRGDALALWDVDETAARAAAARLPDALATAVDVTDLASVESATAEVVARLGRLDVLVNSAGITGPQGPLEEYGLADWKRVLAINLDGVFHCCRAAVPHLRRAPYGRIVNLASIAGKEGNALQCAYSASKAGVIALTKSLGKELARTEIRVNCVAPAVIETELFKQMTPDFIAQVLAKVPLGRPGRPSEVAALVDWLASEECSFATGAVFDASGGRATY